MAGPRGGLAGHGSDIDVEVTYGWEDISGDVSRERPSREVVGPHEGATGKTHCCEAGDSAGYPERGGLPADATELEKGPTTAGRRDGEGMITPTAFPFTMITPNAPSATMASALARVVWDWE